MSDYAETFAKELEKNDSIHELAEKNDSPEGLTAPLTFSGDIDLPLFFMIRFGCITSNFALDFS